MQLKNSRNYSTDPHNSIASAINAAQQLQARQCGFRLGIPEQIQSQLLQAFRL